MWLNWILGEVVVAKINIIPPLWLILCNGGEQLLVVLLLYTELVHMLFFSKEMEMLQSYSYV